MTEHIENAQRGKFVSIEVGRGIASALVVLHHAGNIMLQERFYGAEPFGQHLRNFNVGIDFFFVLSGFIIAWIHWGDIGVSGTIGPYARKRFLRIYPPYWCIVLPLIILYLIFPNAGIPSQHDPVNIGLSIALLPYTAHPVLGVAWTLTYEVFFYCLFGLVLLMGKRALWIFPAWAVLIVGANLTGWGMNTFPFSFFLSPVNIEFIMGIGVAALLRHNRIPFAAPLAVGAAAGFVLLMLFATSIQEFPLVGRLAFAIPAALFVLGAVEVERRRTVTFPSWLVYLGAASYAVYLIHPIVLSGAVQVLVRLTQRDLPLDVAAVLLASAGVMAGIVFHAVIEKRSIAFARRCLERGRGKGKPSLTAAG